MSIAILFAIYISDLEENIADNESCVYFDVLRILSLFYADDVVIFSETPDGLQKEMEFCE